MRKYFRENTQWAIMDLETFSKLTASSIDKTIRTNAEKRKKVKNA